MNPIRKQFRLTTQQLRTLCEQGEALGFANGPTPEFWDMVRPDEEGHLVEYWMEHRPHLPMWEGIDHGFNFAHNGGVNIRALVACVGKGGRELPLLCDFDYHAFTALAKARCGYADGL